MSRQRLHMDGFEEPSARQLRQPPRIIAVGLVRRQRLQSLIGLPALNADDRHSQRFKTMEERWRHSTRLENDPLTAWCPECRGNRLRECRRPCLQHDAAVTIDNADVRLFHGDIQSSKVSHGCSPPYTGEPIVSDSQKSSRPITPCCKTILDAPRSNLDSTNQAATHD